MTDEEKRQLENRLLRMGLSRLDDPNLVPQMACLIKGHEDFQAMLGACDADKRTEMYEALRPHLSFVPKSLEDYMLRVREHAGAVVTFGAPIQVGETKYEAVPRNHAEGCVVAMRCHLCPRTANFYGATPLTAVIIARQDGWVRERGINKEVCPKCECADRGERRKCPTCKRRHYAPDCRALSTQHTVPGSPESRIQLTDA